MNPSISANSLLALQNCLALASDLARHEEANEAFTQFMTTLESDNPHTAELVYVLWKELLLAQRSATVWERICTVERELADRLTNSNFQLQQNYLRLIQEQ